MESEKKYVEQKELHPRNGLVMLLVIILGLVFSIALIIFGAMATGWSPVLGVMAVLIGVVGIIVCSIMFGGLKVVGPNEARVLTLLGNYYGTILTQGFFFVNPFCSSYNPAYLGAIAMAQAAQAFEEEPKGKGQKRVSQGSIKKTISLKNRTLNNGVQKVNDVAGNPIIISAIVIWRVVNPTEAVFRVEDYTEFLSTQTDSIIRNIARMYPYDNMDTEEGEEKNEKTLRGSAQEIAGNMKTELNAKVAFAGLEIEEVRINQLAYAEEIAAAMLKRQQAEAVIAARSKIVDGAVSMVKMAIDKLSEDEVVVLDEERKAAMVSNLMVVLCSDRDAQPVVNSGSIY